MLTRHLAPAFPKMASTMAATVVTFAAASFVPPAFGGAIIYNNTNVASATVALGVQDTGELNFSDYGLSYRFPGGTFRDATSPGCDCEGWGVAVTHMGSRQAGFANRSAGSGGLTGGTFGSTTTTATSSVGLSAAPVQVTHAFGVSLAPNVFQGNVTITNVGTSTLGNVVYRRVMDWDVPPTEFSEYVTHRGVGANLVAAGGNVLFASDNGFASSDPRVAASSILSGTVNGDFVLSGPYDHGSVFDFAFGDLAAGQSRSFNIFYGAAANEAGALEALGILKPNVYSLGQSSLDPTNSPTYLFGFGGVGGTMPGATPEVPVLPFVPAPGEYVFPAPAPRLWYDPPFAIGYRYELVGGGVFTEVRAPAGYSGLTVEVPGSGSIPLPPSGVSFALAGLAPSVFEIRGLYLDTDSDAFRGGVAFPTFLDFTGSVTELRMAAIIESSSVPAPGSLVLVVAGLLIVSRVFRGGPAMTAPMASRS